MATEPPTVEYDEAATCWHLLVQTRGGQVSILKNLDAPTARSTYQRLRLRPVPRGIQYASDSEVVKVSILGPDGADLDPLRGAPAGMIELHYCG